MFLPGRHDTGRRQAHAPRTGLEPTLRREERGLQMAGMASVRDTCNQSPGRPATGVGALRMLWALCIPALLVPLPAQPADDASAASPPRTLVVPGDFPVDDKLARGCWVRLYDGLDFKGRELVLAGPLALPRLEAVSAHWRDWDSVVTGPRAVLSAYTGYGFEGHSAVVQPGERVNDMTVRIGRRDDIESLRVDCVPR